MNASDLWPLAVAVLVWWLGTGLVMLLDGLPRDTHRWSLATSTLLAAGALVCIHHSAGDASVAGAYAGFVCAVVVWGWHELSLLTGWITGPRTVACSRPDDPRTRFGQAVMAVLWHELSLLAMGALILALTAGGENPVAAATFWLLWVMRLSAKLNLFLGVRNLGLEFLPPHLRYMGSYFRRRRFNALMPLSLAGGLALLAVLVAAALQAEGGLRTGAWLLASLTALAVIEHALLVLPLPPTLLWRWALREGPTAASKPVRRPAAT